MKQHINRTETILLAYISITVIASFYLYFSYDHFAGRSWHSYNNYIIFKNSFYHILSCKNLYVECEPVYWDIYKYTPSFALFMGIFAYLPDVLGLTGWNLLNALILFVSIRLLPLDEQKKCFVYWFVLPELLTSIQGMQSNALMAGLLLLAFHSFEHKKLFFAALYISCSAFIKGYGAIGFILFLFYPGKWRFACYSAVCCILLLLLPLLVTTPANLLLQYQNWFFMMRADHDISTGLSLMGCVQSWFGLDVKNGVMLAGTCCFLLPLYKRQQYKHLYFRLCFIAMMLIWMVIFNYKAESQTYIIAITGASLWFAIHPFSRWQLTLIVFILLGTSFSHTDLIPMALKKNWIYPYCIKAVPCIVLWVVMMAELLGLKKTDVENSNLQPNPILPYE